MSQRLVVLLFNLGGPDRPESVRPFLFNLFNDPAIISIPNPFRWLLAKVISTRRAPVAREIYDHLGGKSPLLDETNAQAEAVAKKLKSDGREVLVLPVMRYWHPFANEVARQVKEFEPTDIVALPLYPQYSKTTTGSSFKDWDLHAKKHGINCPTQKICCWPVATGWVESVATDIESVLETIENPGDYRILFSAHGLPKKVIDAGDPYQLHVEKTVEAVTARICRPAVETVVCYQSKVGPLEWIGPATEDEIKRAGKDQKKLIVVPIAFVSEHSETLVELDIEYAELAEDNGVKHYKRVPTVSITPQFIESLVDLIEDRLRNPGSIRAGMGQMICSADRKCPCRLG